MFRLRRLVAVLVVSVGLMAGAGSTATMARADPNTGRLESGESLYPGRSLDASTGPFWLQMQKDGNLVIKRFFNDEPTAVWASGTDGTVETVLFMQEDGNAVLRARGNAPVWASDTASNPGAALELLPNGALVVLSPDDVVLAVVAPPYQDPGDSGAVGDDSSTASDVSRGTVCALIGKKIPRVGHGVDAACGIVTDDGGDTDGYELATMIGCAFTGLFSVGCAYWWDAEEAH